MLDYLKSHWWKILIAIVIVWIIFKWVGSNRKIISKEPGEHEPGKVAPTDTSVSAA